MGDSLQDVYAQNLPKDYGYPLRIPEPSNTLPESYQNDGLHIGDVGYVDDHGRFQVLFNIHHSSQHALHRKRGVPADFQPVELDPEEVDIVHNAIPAKQVIQPLHLMQQLQPSDERVEYEFVASSTGAGAVLILPFGAARHDLKEKEVYRKIAAEQARSWCEFAKRDSLYLLTGFHKTRSWSLASFHNAERAGRIRMIRQVEARDNVGIYHWEHTFPLHWRNGPAIDEDGNENQTVFISGFKIAVRWWAPEPVIVWVPQSGSIWFALYVQLSWFVGFLFGLVNMVWRRSTLKSLEHAPKLSQPFHPSDVINRYLLGKNPNAHVAVTHDSQWMTMLNQEELKYEDLAHEDRLWNFLSERYINVSDDNAVYLQGKIEDIDSGESCESTREFQGFSLRTTPNSNAQMVITHMRVENIVAAPGHIPAGFYVIALVDGVEQRTKSKPILLQESVIGWDDEILMSPNLTFKVRLSVCSCFEFDPLLGRGEVLHTCEISSEELVGNTHLITFLPKETGISPSLLLTLERRRPHHTLTGIRCDIKLQSEGLPSLVEATDNGHAALLRYYRTFRKEDLENSIEQFERAVDLCPSGYDCRTPALFNLAIGRFINSQVYGTPFDLDRAILLFREALESRSLHHPDRPATLLRLAQALLHHCQVQGYQEFIAGEIEQLVTELRRIALDGRHERRAADLVHQTLKRLRVVHSYPPVGLDDLILELDLATRTPPEEYFDRPDRLENLRVALLARSELRREVGDADRAISILEDAVRRTPDDHPDKHTYLINLGNSLMARFNIFGNVADREQAVTKHEAGVRVTPEHHPNLASHLCDLGVSLRVRFSHLGNLDDINSAVAKQERAITLTPNGHPDYAHRLYNLGLSLRACSERLKDLALITRAISIQQGAIRLILECHPERPRFLNGLSLSFMARFKLLGDVGDVEQAIAKLEDSLQITPQEHPKRSLLLNDLGISLMTRFHRLGHLHDLQQAIARLEEAVQFTPLDNPHRASHSNSLGLALCSRFNQLGDPEDIDQAIARQEKAVELTPHDHPDRPYHLNCLGRSNWSRFKRLGANLPDIQQAIERQEVAVKLTPRHDPNYPMYLNDLGLSYLARFEHVGDTDDLEQAIERHEDAVELTPRHDPNYAMYLNDLGLSYMARFEHVGDTHDLEQAIERHENAVELTPCDHPTLPRHLNSLGVAFRARFSHLGDVHDIEHAIKLHEDAIRLTPHDHPNYATYRNDLTRSLSLVPTKVADMRKPYTGTSRALVIALDVGTTFSGVSYAILEPGEIPNIYGVTRFPGQEHVAGNSKIPSILYYDRGGNVMCAGAEADNTFILSQAEDEFWIKAELFKLRLRPKLMKVNMNGMRLGALPRNKTAVDVFGDFLRYLFNCTRKFVIDTHADGSALWRAVEHNIEFVLSHPNGWEGAQQTKMRRAAVHGGLIPDTDNGRAQIRFVTEGEASLHACVQSGLSPAEVLSNQSRHGFLVADAGGGMLDISSYAVRGTNPLVIEEIAPPDCIFAGSVFVSRRAREFLAEKLKSSKYGSSDSIDHITKRFDETTKRLFRDKNDIQWVPFGSPLDKDLSVGIRGGILKLTGAEVADLFEPSIQAAVTSIESQVVASQGIIKSVWLVGGFAASPWLFSQLQERLASVKITVSRPDNQTSKAVADGALGFYCDHHVSARVSKFMYGVEYLREYDPNDQEHVSRQERLCELPSGPKLLPGAFDCILARGVKVKESTVFTRKYCTELTNLSTLSVFEVEIWCYRGGDTIPPWILRHSEEYSTLCVVRADLSPLSGSAEPKSGRNGKTYWTIVFSVEIHFGLTEFKARIKWNDNGETDYGPASIVYSESGHRADEDETDTYPEDTNKPTSPMDLADTTIDKNPNGLAQALTSAWGSQSKAVTPVASPLAPPRSVGRTKPTKLRARIPSGEAQSFFEGATAAPPPTPEEPAVITKDLSVEISHSKDNTAADAARTPADTVPPEQLASETGGGRGFDSTETVESTTEQIELAETQTVSNTSQLAAGATANSDGGVFDAFGTSENSGAEAATGTGDAFNSWGDTWDSTITAEQQTTETSSMSLSFGFGGAASTFSSRDLSAPSSGSDLSNSSGSIFGGETPNQIELDPLQNPTEPQAGEQIEPAAAAVEGANEPASEPATVDPVSVAPDTAPDTAAQASAPEVPAEEPASSSMEPSTTNNPTTNGG